ncbi:MAG: hypothetical protein QHC90_04080 [Shinella sp.]|nr:hypothetical protein [Shinella sp.]
MNVVDLSRARSDQDRPDADLIRYDDRGREMRTYVLDYEMDGSTWGATILAYSMEDAQKRVDAMRKSLSLRGELHAVIPAE